MRNLNEKIKKQEGIIKVIERTMQREGMAAWRKAELKETLAKEIRVLNYMKKFQ